MASNNQDEQNMLSFPAFKPLAVVLTVALLLLSFNIGFSKQNALPTNGKLLFLSDRTGIYQVYAMDLDGNNVHQLTDETRNIEDAGCSPDGKSIAITGSDSGIKLIQLDSQSSSVIFGADVNNFYSDPRWSPDGTRIAFTSTLNAGGGYDIYTSDLNGGNLVHVTNTPHIREWMLTWSPDGTKIAFASGDATSTGIYVVDATGSNLTRLTTNQKVDDFPSWSPDGSKIIFSSEQTNSIGLSTISPSGSNLTVLTNTSGIGDWRPAWSPDGSLIAFDSSRDGNPEIYTMESNGSNVKRLTNNTDNDLVLCWLVSTTTPTATPTSTSTPSAPVITITVPMSTSTPTATP